MQQTFVDEKSLKSLEDYAVFLTSGLYTLQTLYNLQTQAINAGILLEDHAERVNTILWDIRRLLHQYKQQLDGVLELTGEFDASVIIQKLQKAQITKARSLTRKKVQK